MYISISHEFRTPLTLILNPLNDIIKGDFSNLSLTTKNKLEIIHKNSNRLSRLINELMDFRKLQFNKMLSVRLLHYRPLYTEKKNQP